MASEDNDVEIGKFADAAADSEKIAFLRAML